MPASVSVRNFYVSHIYAVGVLLSIWETVIPVLTVQYNGVYLMLREMKFHVRMLVLRIQGKFTKVHCIKIMRDPRD